MTAYNEGPNSIAFYRERKGLTQEQAAAQCGVTLDYYKRIEAGTEPRLTQRMAPLATLLEVSVEEIVGRPTKA